VKLYGFWRSLATFRVRIALNLKGLAYEEIPVNLLAGAQFAADYAKVNPQSVVPALVEDDGTVLFQSLAIVEYLDEKFPRPALMPADHRARARVRGIAQIMVADAHPLVVPRVRAYLERDLALDEATRNTWLRHWNAKALEAVEAQLAGNPRTGRFCQGDAVTVADVCLVPQMIGSAMFGVDITQYPTAHRVLQECMKDDAFARAHPLRQADAPKQ